MTRPTTFEMRIDDFELGTEREGYRPVRARTSRGDLHFRWYPAAGATRAVVFFGGVGGGWDTPAEHLYPTLAQELVATGLSSLRVRFRHPGRLEECVLDVLAGIGFVSGEGIEQVAVVGHSFGGAVAIQAGVQSDRVRTVVTIATQSYGAECVDVLPATTSLLLLHGTDDPVLPPFCSEHLAELAHEPKRLVIFEGAGHCLDEVASDVRAVVREWLTSELGGA